MNNHWRLKQNRRVTDTVLSFPFPCSRVMYLSVTKVWTAGSQGCTKRCGQYFLMVLEKPCKLSHRFSIFTVDFGKVVYSQMLDYLWKGLYNCYTGVEGTCGPYGYEHIKKIIIYSSRSKFDCVLLGKHKAELELTGTFAQPVSGKGFVYETMNNGSNCDSIDFLPRSIS